MSRLAKNPIEIPVGVTVATKGGALLVSGPKGKLERPVFSEIIFTITDKDVVLAPKKKTLFLRALLGTYAAHVKNMITGVTKGFEKKLIIEGIGYKAVLAGKELVLSLGFSHPVKLKIPEGLAVAVEKNAITVSGADKEIVGQFASVIRSKKIPEPYKGKGIRYDGEVVRRKQGKKAAA
jgi:large subunit ribosomal protein L6